MKLKITALAIALSLGLSACSNETSTTKTDTQGVSATVQSESEKANKMFDDMFMEGVMRSPIYQTYMAIKKDYGKWDDISEARGLEDHEFAKANLVKLQTLDSTKLDSQTALSYKLLEQQLEDEIADYKWRNHNYPVNQMFGLHSMIPSLLINQHSISSESDAVAYISRLNGVRALLAELENGLNKRAELGILAPKFVNPYVISDSENLLNGAPFTNGNDSTLLEDFKRKVTALEIDKSVKAQLLADAKKALIKSVKPGYESLVMTLKN
jgi:uncharacterized protein (DUF885 family)